MTQIQKCNFVLILVGMFFISMKSAVIIFQKNDKTNFYQYGDVNESKDNIENLFRNFSVYVENGEDVDFLGYRFLGTIKLKRDAQKYVRENFKHLPPIGWTTSWSSDFAITIPGETAPVGKSSVRLHSTPIRESKTELKKMAKTIAEEYVKPGDEIYAIDFTLNLQKYTHYVFVKPESKQVLLKGNVFGLEIPVSHFGYK